MDRIAIATVNTLDWKFQTVGRDADHAATLMHSAWRTHAEQTGADLAYLTQDPSIINVAVAQIGDVFRDNSPFRILPAGHGDHSADAHTREATDDDQAQDGDGNLLCNDCLEDLFYCSITDTYHHVRHTARACFLVQEQVA